MHAKSKSNPMMTKNLDISTSSKRLDRVGLDLDHLSPCSDRRVATPPLGGVAEGGQLVALGELAEGAVLDLADALG
jgi:hypothetical protein